MGYKEVKTPIRHCDMVEGNRYKVIKRPEHLNGVHYPWLNMIGICKWSNNCHGALMSFGGCKERLIPHECLEAVEPKMDDQSDKFKDDGDGLLTYYKNLGLEKKKEDEVNSCTIEAKGIKIGDLYRIIKVPDFWKDAAENGDYPALNKIGKLIRLHQSGGIYNAGTLRLGDGTQRFAPFDCIEEVKTYILPEPIMDLADDKLLDIILRNPRGALKIVKGLAKMNKDPRAIAFVQKGMLF